MGRPVWLLDVDGVINVARPGWDAAPRSGNAYADATVYRMRWAPALIERIRTLQLSGTVEIRWCSTWCSQADQIERLFALPQLGRSWCHGLSAVAASDAKLTEARAVLARGARLIWTDDADVPKSGPVNDELNRTGQTLLIAPSPRRGLQPDHMDAIEAFVTDALADNATTEAEALLLARRLLGDDK